MARVKKPGRQPRPIPNRREGNRPPAPRVLIVCAGVETEKKYFNALKRELRLSALTVDPLPRDAISVVRRAALLRGKDDYDQVWCVLDVENPIQNPGFDQAIDEAKKRQFELAVSNPAFEYWYLVHFKETTRPFHDAADLIEALKEFTPDYQKNCDVFARLYEHTDQAIARASRLLEDHPDNDEFPNPSTLVFKLVKRLRDLSRNG